MLWNRFLAILFQGLRSQFDCCVKHFHYYFSFEITIKCFLNNEWFIKCHIKICIRFFVFGVICCSCVRFYFKKTKSNKNQEHKHQHGQQPSRSPHVQRSIKNLKQKLLSMKSCHLWKKPLNFTYPCWKVPFQRLQGDVTSLRPSSSETVGGLLPLHTTENSGEMWVTVSKQASEIGNIFTFKAQQWHWRMLSAEEPWQKCSWGRNTTLLNSWMEWCLLVSLKNARS